MPTPTPIIKFNGREQYFNAQNYLNTGERHLFCLSRTTVKLALALISNYGKWRNRYFIRDENGLMRQPDDEQWQLIIDTIDIALHELINPMCDELETIAQNVGQLNETLRDLLTNQNDILASLVSALVEKEMTNTNTQTVTVTCGGCGCSNTGTDTPPPTTELPEIPIDEPITLQGVPDGFGSMAEYLQYKCVAVTFFVRDVLIPTLAGIETLVSTLRSVLYTLFGGYIAEWILTTVLQVPQSDIEELRDFLNDYCSFVPDDEDLFNDLSNYVNDNQDRIICRLYELNSTLEIIDAIIDELENGIETIVVGTALGAYVGSLKTIVGGIGAKLYNNNIINQLFYFVATIAVLYPNANCGCDDETPPTELCYELAGWFLNAEKVSTTGQLTSWNIYPKKNQLDDNYSVSLLTKVAGSNDIYILYYVDDSSLVGLARLNEFGYKTPSEYFNNQFPVDDCVELIYAVAPGNNWYINVTIDQSQMDNCTGCTDDPPPNEGVIYPSDAEALPFTGSCQQGAEPVIIGNIEWLHNPIYFGNMSYAIKITATGGNTCDTGIRLPLQSTVVGNGDPAPIIQMYHQIEIENGQAGGSIAVFAESSTGDIDLIGVLGPGLWSEGPTQLQAPTPNVGQWVALQLKVNISDHPSTPYKYAQFGIPKIIPGSGGVI